MLDQSESVRATFIFTIIDSLVLSGLEKKKKKTPPSVELSTAIDPGGSGYPLTFRLFVAEL